MPAKTAESASRGPSTAPARPSRWLLILSCVLLILWMLFLLAMALTA